VLTGALGDRTRLIVGHRASTVAQMDAVVWLDAGRLRAMAPHHELWRDPDYRALFEPDAPPAPGPRSEAAIAAIA
jgi:ATP-binding cassette subfamily B protein